MTGTDNSNLIRQNRKNITTQKYIALSERAAILLANGGSIQGTAAIIGVNRDTLERWLKAPNFAELVEAKKEELREKLLKKISEAGEKTHLWQANAWLLEQNKVFGGEFTQPKAQAVNVGNIQVNIILPSPPVSQGETTITLTSEPCTGDIKDTDSDE